MMDIKELKDGINTLGENAMAFFDAAIAECSKDTTPQWKIEDEGRNGYWDRLSHERHQ